MPILSLPYISAPAVCNSRAIAKECPGNYVDSRRLPYGRRRNPGGADGQGYIVNAVQIGNDEKNSIALSPADTRLTNNREGEFAAKMLGVREVFILNHKSGELAFLTNEITAIRSSA